MSIVGKTLASSFVLGGAYAMSQFMPAEKPFSEMPAAEYRVLEKYDTDEKKNWISFEEGTDLLTGEFSNPDGSISQTKAVGFLSRLWVDNSSFSKPLNVAISRNKILAALYKMSPNTNEVHRNLTEEIQKLREEQK